VTLNCIARTALICMPLTAYAENDDDATQPSVAPIQSITITGEKEAAVTTKPLPGGQLARGARLGLLGNVDTLTVPFSLKSYTDEFVLNQGARNVDELLANDPSARASLASGFVLDQSSIRGFPVASAAYRIDGVAGLISYARAIAQNFERIELLKGPATGVYGSGGGGFSVGGVVNLVPKRAKDLPTTSFTLGLSERSAVQVHADLGRRFFDGALGVRLNVVAEDGELPNTTQRENLAPQLSLDWRGESWRATLDAGYTRYENRRPGVNHSLGAGQTLPTPPSARRSAQPPFAVQQLEGDFHLVGGELDIGNALVAYAKLGQYKEDIGKSFIAQPGPLRSDGSFTVNNVTYNTWKTDNETADVGLRGDFRTGPVQHQLALSWARFETHYRIPPTGQGTPPVPPFTPVPGTIYADYPITNPFNGPPTVGPYTGTPAIQRSVGIADNMSLLDDRVTLIVGLRDQAISQGSYSGQRISPTLAASFKLSDRLALYGNHATALVQGSAAPSGTANAGENLPPFEAKQFEMGAKWNAGAWGLSIAAFSITQAAAFTDPADNLFKAAGEQRNRGIELETFGEPVKGFRVLGGFAYIDGRQTKTRAGATDGKRALGVSDTNLNLGAEFDVAAVPGLTVTGRVIHTGEAYIDLANTQQVPAWNVVDVSARYRTTLAGRGVMLRAGIDNLLDRAYWRTGGRNIFVVASPRTWRLSATVDF
jgi:iron complex outermembrane recepter protein